MATRRWNRMILGSLVLTHYQRVTDRQTDRQTVVKSRSSIAELSVTTTVLICDQNINQ